MINTTEVHTVATSTFFWRPRHDWVALLVILLLPFAVALPDIIGLLHNNPLLYVSGIAQNVRTGILPGHLAIDPNDGFTTQALGRLAAAQWLHGKVPWWNPFSGAGLPLAAEYQSGAFFPPVLLLLLDNGMLWLRLFLQVAGGWGCYALLRQMGLSRYPAIIGGVLFSFNGTLAWFQHAPSEPVPFLPWLLFSIERTFTKVQLAHPGGWRLIAISLGLMLLAGFPETAYICGLFALLWAVIRCLQCDRRIAMACRLALGGTIGVTLAAPQIQSFIEFLPHAFLGGHGGAFAHASLSPGAALSSLLAPYVYGPIFAFGGHWTTANANWGSIGGYVDLLILMLAACGLRARRDTLSFLLTAWVLLALCKTFGILPIANWWNLVPGIGRSAFFRFAQPTWELALIILASFGVSALDPDQSRPRGMLLSASATFLLGIAAGGAYGTVAWMHSLPSRPAIEWSLFSAGWEITLGLVAIFLLAQHVRWRMTAIGILLVFDAVVLFAIPMLSAPRGGKIDTAAISFLKKNIGLQRFFTLGPIAPNYGAYFRIASINHNYLPVPNLWIHWIRTHLDSAANPILFIGNIHRGPNQPTPEQELRRNLSAYEDVGVKYIVTPNGDNPFNTTNSTYTTRAKRNALVFTHGRHIHGIPKRVYEDQLLNIYALSHTKSYFTTTNGNCRLHIVSRENCLRDAEKMLH